VANATVAKRQPPRTNQPELTFPAKKASRSPEEVARAAVAKRPTTPAGRVSYTLTLAFPRKVAEALTARAIREGKRLDALIAEILEGDERPPAK
jgi:hypothetical protein